MVDKNSKRVHLSLKLKVDYRRFCQIEVFPKFCILQFIIYSVDGLFCPITYFSLLIQLNKLRHPLVFGIASDRHA
jgi:hypothetical protein